MLPAAILVLCMDVIGVSLYFTDDMQVGGVFVNQEYFYRAYAATLCACALLVVCYFVFGMHREFSAYQARDMSDWSEARYYRLWIYTSIAGAIGVVVLWMQAGFRVPLIETLGVDFIRYSELRSYYTRTINQTIFFIVLYMAATPSAVIAWFCIKGRALPKVLSLFLLACVGAFTLARSPLALGGLIALNYALLVRSVSLRLVVLGCLASVVVLIVTHSIAGGGENYAGYESMQQYLFMRVAYGEWLALPTFMAVFEHNHASLLSIINPELQSVFGAPVDTPSRLAMIDMNPEAVASDRAGVANTFFVGDAYAVFGTFGVFIAPVVVMGELWVLGRAMRALPKSPITVYLYAWCLFKFLVGILGGFASFLVAALPLVVAILVVAVAIRMPRGTLARTLRIGHR